LNAAEITARAQRAGFIPVEPASLSVAEQVRLFAESSHLLSLGSAGLGNLLFCSPGARVCEWRSGRVTDARPRSLAALRGVRYGCLLGSGETRGRWQADPDRLDSLLADPRFALR
jgi:capsular polysaccharide biosynthesis protein